MEKKDNPHTSPQNIGEPEGVFAEEEFIDTDDAVRLDKPQKKNGTAADGAPKPEDDKEGIQINKHLFDTGELASSIGFSPEDEPLPTQTSPVQSKEDDALAFSDLSAEPAELDPDAPKIVRKKVVQYEKGGIIKGFSAVLIYLLLVIVAGVLSALAIISVANDIFAFTKDDTVYELVIDDPNMTLEELADYLHEEGIIRYPTIFRLYVGLKEEDGIALHEGTVSISPSYNYDKIITCLDPPPVREEVTITFSEGLTVDDIIDIFLENGIGTRAGFIDVIENYEFEYWFLEGLETSEDRFYRLEGYLYPDTYRFYSDSSEAAALTKMLDNFERKVPDTYRDRCAELGLTLDEAVILASLIESECARINDLEYVSAVFHNRMNSSSFQGRLDSDATIQYYFRHTTGARKPDLTVEDLAIDSPYNTRVYKGLTPGAICNPSLNALMAAVYPNTTCGYYYFVAQSNGYNLYAKTLAEHNRNVALVRQQAGS